MTEIVKPKHSNDETDRRAYGEKLEEFREALTLLYIKRNQSGRLKFAEKWPVAAQYIFGPDLIEIDTRGPTLEEYKIRETLEEGAEDRRIQVKRMLAELKEKSVISGVLQFDYVGKVVGEYGGAFSRILFADYVIERVSPGLLAKVDEEARRFTEEQDRDAQKSEEVIRARAQSLPSVQGQRGPITSGEAAAKHSAVDISDEIRPIDSSPVVVESFPAVEVALSATAVSQEVEKSSVSLDEVQPISVSGEGAVPVPVPVVSVPAVEVSPTPAAVSVAVQPEKGWCMKAFNRSARSEAVDGSHKAI